MDSPNKPTLLHFCLIFFVMTTVILSVLYYVTLLDLRQMRGDEAEARVQSMRLPEAADPHQTAKKLIVSRLRPT